LTKLVEIVKAWYTSIDPTEEQKEIAEYRASVCEGCPFNAYLDIAKLHYCSKCGCPLKKKIFSPVSTTCPEQKWER